MSTFKRLSIALICLTIIAGAILLFVYKEPMLKGLNAEVRVAFLTAVFCLIVLGATILGLNESEVKRGSFKERFLADVVMTSRIIEHLYAFGVEKLHELRIGKRRPVRPLEA